VRGPFRYFHYGQDADDAGWGCAYRSLQTIGSWLQDCGLSPLPPPSHREIQQALVALDDKPRSFVGSRQWIGAVEVSLVLGRRYGVTCRILDFPSGDRIPERARELAAHFALHGSPIMVGGGVLAYTLLGIAWDPQSGECRFLILDPHYVGRDELRSVLDKGWCAWHKPDIFLSNAFYNLCLPLCPDTI
jgi:hypothetical protein